MRGAQKDTALAPKRILFLKYCLDLYMSIRRIVTIFSSLSISYFPLSFSVVCVFANWAAHNERRKVYSYFELKYR